VDQVKSKLQADTIGRYTGPRDCIQQTWVTEGIRGFFRGLSTCVVRAFAVNAATFWGVNYVATVLIKNL